MKSKAIPTVEQFIIFKEVFDGMVYSALHKREFKLSELLHEYAVLFARYHREQQLEATVNNFYTNYIGLKSKAYIKQDLENAYSEDEIK